LKVEVDQAGAGEISRTLGEQVCGLNGKGGSADATRGRHQRNARGRALPVRQLSCVQGPLTGLDDLFCSGVAAKPVQDAKPQEPPHCRFIERVRQRDDGTAEPGRPQAFDGGNRRVRAGAKVDNEYRRPRTRAELRADLGKVSLHPDEVEPVVLPERTFEGLVELGSRADKGDGGSVRAIERAARKLLDAGVHRLHVPVPDRLIGVHPSG
jgi:hypothetical protein